MAISRHHCPLLSSLSTAVRQFVKNPHLRILPVTSADFLHKIYPQFTRCNIRIFAHPHFTIACPVSLARTGRCMSFHYTTQTLVTSMQKRYFVWPGVKCGPADLWLLEWVKCGSNLLQCG